MASSQSLVNSKSAGITRILFATRTSVPADVPKKRLTSTAAPDCQCSIARFPQCGIWAHYSPDSSTGPPRKERFYYAGLPPFAPTRAEKRGRKKSRVAKDCPERPEKMNKATPPFMRDLTEPSRTTKSKGVYGRQRSREYPRGSGRFRRELVERSSSNGRNRECGRLRALFANIRAGLDLSSYLSSCLAQCMSFRDARRSQDRYRGGGGIAMESGRRETLSDPACFVSSSRIRALMISEHLAKTRRPNRREDGPRRSPAPDHGAAGCNLPPSRTMATRLASPVASSVSTKRPDRVAAPRAGVRRPLDMPVTRRRKGSSFSIPITE